MWAYCFLSFIAGALACRARDESGCCRRKPSTRCRFTCLTDRARRGKVEPVTRIHLRLLLQQDFANVVGIRRAVDTITEYLKNMFDSLRIVDIDVDGIIGACIAAPLKCELQ